MFLFVAGAIALGQQSPRRGQLLPATAGFGLACATTVRMVDGVTSNTAVDGANAAMTRAAGFAEDYVFVLGIADLADGGIAIFVDTPNFARRKANLGIAFVARHQRCSATSSSDHLAAAARRQFDV